MKKKVLFFAVLLTPFFALAAPNLEGVWRLKERECTAGAPKQDGVNLDRDKIFLSLKAGAFRLDYNVFGMRGGLLGTYTQHGNRVEVIPRKRIDAIGRETPSTDAPTTVHATINGEGKLVLVTEEFKKVGHCPAGASLVLTLVKQSASRSIHPTTSFHESRDQI